MLLLRRTVRSNPCRRRAGMVDHWRGRPRCGADSLVCRNKFSLAALGQHDGLAPDRLGIDVGRSATGEGGIHRGDMGNESAWIRVDTPRTPAACGNDSYGIRDGR